MKLLNKTLKATRISSLFLLFIMMLLPMLVSVQEVEINGIYCYLYLQMRQTEVTSGTVEYIGNVAFNSLPQY